MKKLIKKQILIYLLNMIIIIIYYILIYKKFLYINDEVVTTCITTVEKLKSIEVSNVWYKSIIDDFFNKFTTKSKTIDNKYFDMKSFIKPLIIEYNQDILNNIRSNHINSLILECEDYKKIISNLEMQIHYTRMIHNNLINDLYDILKEVEKWRK